MSEGSPAEERAKALADAVNGHPEQLYAALPELAALLEHTWAAGDDDALWEVINALGLCSHPRAAALLLPLARAGHRDPAVRQRLAWAFCTGVGGEELRRQVIDVLIPMTGDPQTPVRDWACCALGANGADDPRSCDALAARLDDVDCDTRCEALLALAAAGDARALPAVLAALTGDDDIQLLQLEAAAELASPALLAALDDLVLAWAGDDDRFTQHLHRVLPRCHPGAAAHAQRIEEEISAAVQEGVLTPALVIRLAGAWPRTLVQRLGDDGTPVSDATPLRLWNTFHDPATTTAQELLLRVRRDLDDQATLLA